MDPDGHSPVDVVFLVYDIGKLGLAVYSGAGIAAAAADVALSGVGVLSPVPAVGEALKAARAANDAREASGTYRIIFKSGNEYIGKGLEKRMEQSAERLAEKHGDQVVEKIHTPASSSREAFKEESRQIEAAGGARSQNKNTKLYNEIDSPGTKMRKQDGE